jgi:hypothetical protein
MNDNVKKAIIMASDIKDSVNESIRKTGIISRLKTVIKCERATVEREYAEIGRYYYNNLRNQEIPECEVHCKEIEEATKRIISAQEHLSNLEK